MKYLPWAHGLQQLSIQVGYTAGEGQGTLDIEGRKSMEKVGLGWGGQDLSLFNLLPIPVFSLFFLTMDTVILFFLLSTVAAP